MAGEASKEEVLKAQTRVWNETLGFVRPMSLLAAIQLGIPDAVHRHGGPISLPELASAVGVPEAKIPALRRLMRLLCHSGFSHREAKPNGGEVYSPTILSQQLVGDSPTTAAPLVRTMTYPQLVMAWYSMVTWLRSEGSQTPTAFEAAHGEPLWGLLRRVPEFNGVFNVAMGCDSQWSVGHVVREHPEVFQGLSSLVDVGGGNGAAAKAIKEAFPEMRCAVLELPHVVADSPEIEGVEFVLGDMFQHVPPAHAVLLKWVLHTSNDEDAVRILQRCKEAIPSRELGGKVIIIDIVVGSGDGGGGDQVILESQLLFDLFMLAVTGGKQRDEAEWRQIFSAAGFSDCKITPGLGPRSIIEVYP